MAFPLSSAGQNYLPSYDWFVNNTPQPKNVPTQSAESAASSETENLEDFQRDEKIRKLADEAEEQLLEKKMKYAHVLACECLKIDPYNLKCLKVLAIFALCAYELDEAERIILDKIKPLLKDPENNEQYINLYITLLFLQSRGDEVLNLCKKYKSQNRLFITDVINNHLTKNIVNGAIVSKKKIQGILPGCVSELGSLVNSDTKLGPINQFLENLLTHDVY